MGLLRQAPQMPLPTSHIHLSLSFPHLISASSLHRFSWSARPHRLTTTLACVCRLRPDLAPACSHNAYSSPPTSAFRCLLFASSPLRPDLALCLPPSPSHGQFSSADHRRHLAVSTPARPRPLSPSLNTLLHCPTGLKVCAFFPNSLLHFG